MKKDKSASQNCQPPQADPWDIKRKGEKIHTPELLKIS